MGQSILSGFQLYCNSLGFFYATVLGTARLTAAVILVASLFGLHFSSHGNELTSRNEIFVAVGGSSEIEIVKGQSVHAVRSPVFKLVDLKSKLLILGKKVGDGEIWLGAKRIVIRVLPDSSSEGVRQALQVLNSIYGIQSRWVNSQMTVQGRIWRLDDFERIQKIASANAIPFEFKGQFESSLHPALKQKWRHALQSRGLPFFPLTLAPVYEVRVPKDLKERASMGLLAQSMGLPVRDDADWLSPAPTLYLEIKMAQITREASRSLGLAWSHQFAGQVFPQAKSEAHLRGQLNALENKGLAKVLAQPKLLCRSGGQAEFHAGGEIPIPVVHNRSKDIVWKKHGLILHFQPLMDRRRRLSLKVQTELSLLAPSQGIGEIPGLLTQRIESEFDLHQPQTVVLSGLLREDLSEGLDRVPALGSIPVLGALFSSRSWREQKSELVVFVTPIPMDSDEL